MRFKDSKIEFGALDGSLIESYGNLFGASFPIPRQVNCCVLKYIGGSSEKGNRRLRGNSSYDA